MKKPTRKFCLTFLSSLTLAFLALNVVSCQSTKSNRLKPLKENPQLILKIHPDYEHASMAVDLVGVNPSELENWNQLFLDEYFQPDNSFRRVASKKTYFFGGENKMEQTLEPDDKIWMDWKAKGSSYIFIMADLPGNIASSSGTDVRRQKIPIDKRDWAKKPQEIQVLIKPDGITLTPSPMMN